VIFFFLPGLSRSSTSLSRPALVEQLEPHDLDALGLELAQRLDVGLRRQFEGSFVELMGDLFAEAELLADRLERDAADAQLHYLALALGRQLPHLRARPTSCHIPSVTPTASPESWVTQSIIRPRSQPFEGKHSVLRNVRPPSSGARGSGPGEWTRRHRR
jgi:hypothetical protein